MATELGVAYLSIIPETSKLAPGIRKALGGAERDADSTGSNIGSRMSSALGKALKTGAVVAGTAAVGLLGTALYKGFNRLTGIENATAKLNGLGHSADSVKQIMNNALASVKGTAFGLDQAATVAATTVASGIKPGKDLERVLRLVADSATIAGTDMASMGAIFSKVAASNKIQGDVIAQLGDAGIPIVQLLGKELGKTASEVIDMASKGEIGFETFADAMEAGLGGAALESGATLEGAFANVQAALGRIGAGLLVGVFPQIKGFLNGSIDVLGSLEDKAQEVGAVIGASLGSTFSWVGAQVRETSAWITSTLVPAVTAGGEALAAYLTPRFQALSDAVRTNVVPAVSEFATGLTGRAVPALKAIGDFIVGTVMPALREFFTSEGFLNGVSMAWQTLRTVAVNLIGVFTALWPAVKQIAEMLGDLFVEMRPALVATFSAAFTTLNVAIRAAAKIVRGLAKVVGATVDWFYRWQDVLVPLVVGFGTFVTVLKLYRLTVAAVIAIQVAWQTVTTGLALAIWGMTGAIRASSAALLANPFVLVAALVLGLVAAFVVAYKKSETFRDIVNKVWAAIKAGAEFVFNWLKKNWPLVLAIITGPVGLVVYGIIKYWDKIKFVTMTTFNLIRDFVVGVFNKIKGGIEFYLNAVQLYISTVVGVIRGIFNGMVSIVGTVVGFFINIKNGIVNQWNTLIGFITGLPGRIASAASGMWDGIKNSFKSAINSIIGWWNDLSFTIPAISVMGAEITPSFTVGTPNIPFLAEGGIVSRPTLAMVGEAGPEAVMPLPRIGDFAESIVASAGLAGDSIDYDRLADAMSRRPNYLTIDDRAAYDLRIRQDRAFGNLSPT